MDVKALQLCARFAISPNQLGYCGRKTAGARFKNCIKNGIIDGLEEEIEKFIVLNPYLGTISKIINKNKFSYDVIEAYIFGNESLIDVNNKDYELLLKNFKKQGVPVWLVKDLKNNKPTKFIPTNLFQVLHVGVGRASGSVPYNLETINNCMFRWGKVTEIKNEKLIMKINSLDKDFKLILKGEEFKKISFLTPKIKIGDTVAVHWGVPVKILTEDEISKLEYWTNEVLKVTEPQTKLS